MLYLSQVTGAPVENQQEERIGRLVDVLVPEDLVGSNKATYPSALLVAGEADQFWRISPQDMQQHEGAIQLRVPATQLVQGDVKEHEVRLARVVLDKQVINIERKKAIRVNDICFDDDWRILGVDNSPFGLVRRLAPSWLLSARSQHAPTDLVPWSEIELIGNSQLEEVARERSITEELRAIKRIPTGHLADLHPADIAGIVHQLTAGQGAHLIERLDDETAADVMEEIDTERQSHILENIQPERAANILQTMGPDEAADLLARLPEERKQELLRLMAPEESEDVQELLEYEQDTAGGLMTTDYIVLNQDRTVAEALDVIRSNIRENNIRIAYIYCVEDETQEDQHIAGVVSLWDLLVSVPTQQLVDLMETDVITVQVDSDAQSVAEIMAKYNFLAVPVVDAEGILQGVVTVDDALDVLLPPEHRRRPSRMY
jgi:CBS domain-containing protein